jgi:D-proline reductase (dithiol) PrdB
VLAHVFEAAGIATVVLSSVREMAAKVSPPRVLHCEFPLGRPLGKPGDAAFQHDVLGRAFALLEATSGPVFTEHPEVIEADDQPVACALPPRYDPTLPPAVDEARGLRRAYDRAVAKRGATSVGRVMSADEVPAMVGLLQDIADGADGTDWKSISGKSTALCHDIRTYYEEAALELVDGPAPGARAMEDWFFEKTEAGRTMLAARAAMRDAGAKFPVWFYMVPGHR